MERRPYDVFEIYLAVAPDGRGYVGCTSKTAKQRWAGHYGGLPRPWPGVERASIDDAIKHFGKASFELHHIASAVGVDNAAHVETALIAQHGTMTPGGYNRAAISNIRQRQRAA